MMKRLFLTVLCLGFALGSKSPAWDVAAKHLEDYRQQRKACGDEDALQVLRLQCMYHQLKDDTLCAESGERNMAFILALHEKAYRLAETRYTQGLGTLWDVYETGFYLYQYSESCASLWSAPSRPAPQHLISLERLKELRQTLSQTAMAQENRERWLKAEILWIAGMGQDRRKVRAYRAELLELQRNRYRHGLATYWDVALAELDLQEEGLFLPPAEEVLQRWEKYSQAISQLYEQMRQAAEASPSYDFSQKLCELRLRQMSIERTLSILNAVPSIITQEVAKEEALSVPPDVNTDSGASLD